MALLRRYYHTSNIITKFNYNKLIYTKVRRNVAATKHLIKSNHYVGLLPSLSGLIHPSSRSVWFEDSEMRPKNEGPLHFNIKTALAEQLKNADIVSIIKTCSTTQKSYSIYPLWTCNKAVGSSKWISSWDDVQTEYRIKGAGKIDIALLKTGLFLPKTIGCIEVFDKGPMTQKKVQALQDMGIPWIQIRTRDFIYNPDIDLKSLRVYSTSDGPIVCKTCKNSDAMKLRRIVLIMDLYPQRKLWRGSVRSHRIVFAVYKKKTPSGKIHMVLVEGCYDIVTTDGYRETFNRETVLLDDVKHATEEECYKKFESAIQTALSKYVEYDPDIIVDTKLKWPGMEISSFYRLDKLSHLVNFEQMNNLHFIYPCISRIYNTKYKWSDNESCWVLPNGDSD